MCAPTLVVLLIPFKVRVTLLIHFELMGKIVLLLIFFTKVPLGFITQINLYTHPIYRIGTSFKIFCLP